MKLIQTQPWLFSTGLLLFGSLALSGIADEPRFKSVAERTLDKRFVQHSELKLADLKVSIEGPDGPEEPEIKVPFQKITDDETIEFSDETLTAGEGRPAKLKRSFTTIDNATEFQGGEDGAESNTVKNESGLDGKSVLFTWNAEEEKFEAKWFEEKGNDALLEPMVEDADFRGWLPGKKVDEGDTWTIPGKEFNNLQEPSGPMGYRPEGSEEDADKAAEEDPRPEMKGDIKATYKGTRDEDGVKVGVIAFEGKLSSVTEREIEQEGQPNAHESTEFSTELEGELLWDLSAGHFHSLSCDAAQKLVVTGTSSIEIGEASIKFKQERTLEGTKTYRFNCSAKK